MLKEFHPILLNHTPRKQNIFAIIINQEAPLPHQGWKIHVSSTSEHYQSVLTHIFMLFKILHFNFKYVFSQKDMISLINRHAERLSGGKLITIYPYTKQETQFLLKKLATILKYFEGPEPLSDQPYNKLNNLSYRYGVINPFIPELNTESVDFWFDGKFYPDNRLPYFELPTFVDETLFPEQNTEKEISYLFSNYEVKEALQFTFGGGVYRGKRITDKQPVIIKEGRPFVGHNFENSSQKLLYHELKILNLFDYLDNIPKVIDFFREDDHLYLVESDLKAETLSDWISHEALNVTPTNRHPQLLKEFKLIFLEIVNTVTAFHSQNVALRDIHSANILIKDRHAYFIDFEESVFTNQSFNNLSDISYLGYEFTHNTKNLIQRDWQRVGLIMLEVFGATNRHLAVTNIHNVWRFFLYFTKIYCVPNNFVQAAHMLLFESNNLNVNVLKDILLSSTYNPCSIAIETIPTNHHLQQPPKVNDLIAILSPRFQDIYKTFLNRSSNIIGINEQADKVLSQINITAGPIPISYNQETKTFTPYFSDGAAGLIWIMNQFYNFLSHQNKLRLATVVDAYQFAFSKSPTFTQGSAGIGFTILNTFEMTHSRKLLDLVTKYYHATCQYGFYRNSEIWYTPANYSNHSQELVETKRQINWFFSSYFKTVSNRKEAFHEDHYSK
ncbi:MAG: hypothetical protein ABF415_00695 [Leuconostoc pseudomesenteroides]|uniref:class III lanthionine synthetase LanKC N-terminal domain-containing protein n=1 Tax=Leuconostoc pseudomesenteroides TaxID=33968 RepID=UPI0039ECF75C